MIRFGIVFLLVALSGCATVMQGTSQSVTVITDPPGAACIFERDGESIGAISSTPGSARFGRGARDITITCNKDGYQTTKVSDSSHVVAAGIGNIVAGGLIGVVVDAATGANFDYIGEVRAGMDTKPGTDTPAPTHIHCPEAGTQAGRTNSSYVIYKGPDPDRADGCLLLTGADHVTSFYFAMEPTDDADAAVVHDAWKSVLYGQPGTVGHYTVGTDADQWIIDARMADPDALVLNDKIVRTRKLVLHKRKPAASIEGEETIWFDPIDGLPLKRIWVQISGPKTDDQDWTVITLHKV